MAIPTFDDIDENHYENSFILHGLRFRGPRHSLNHGVRRGQRLRHHLL